MHGCSNTEVDDIVRELKENKYARLEIELRYPYNYRVVIPQY